MFYDDEFNLNPARTIDLCEELSKRNYQYRGFVKSNLVVSHPEVISAMKKAGFIEVLAGIESGSERILGRHLRKGTTPEINRKAAEVILENGLKLKALTMLGHTSETEADIITTHNWLLDVGKMFNDRLGQGYFTFDLTLFQPYPGSPIYDKAERNTGANSLRFPWVYKTKRRTGEEVDPEFGGIYFERIDFSQHQAFYKGRPGEYQAFVETQNVSPERYVQLRDEIEYEVRERLGMPQINNQTAQIQHEHSMGQGNSYAVTRASQTNNPPLQEI